MKGKTEATEVWSLVAKKGSLTGAASLDGWQISSLIGFSPRFIRGPVLGAWGKLPESVKFVQTARAMSEMRKAAKGDKVALVLDSEQTAALASSPYASDLEVVYTAPALPSAIFATVGGRIADARWKPMAAALPKLGDTPDGAKALEGVWKLKFSALDDKALAAAQKLFKEAR
jgi:hypothetical protein